MRRKKILLADDDPDFVTIVKYVLEINGFEVIVAHNGTEARQKAKDLPDMILLDVRMPEKDGFEVINYLRNDALTANIPVIMLTLTGDVNSILKAEGLGIKDYIIKTASLEMILNKVKKYLDEDGSRLSVKPNEIENCWEYWDCPEETKEKCIVFKKEWQHLCWLATSFPQAKRGFDSCNNCPWRSKKLKALKR